MPLPICAPPAPAPAALVSGNPGGDAAPGTAAPASSAAVGSEDAEKKVLGESGGEDGGAAPGWGRGRRARVGNSSRLSGRDGARSPGTWGSPPPRDGRPPIPQELPDQGAALPAARAPLGSQVGGLNWGYPRRALSLSPVATHPRVRRGKKRQSGERIQGGMEVDVGMGQAPTWHGNFGVLA